MTASKKWPALKKRLARSKFRSQFGLSDDERSYVHDRGLELVRNHACDFIRQRLAPANPRNDGKQTPMKGHPVFLAQHATGACCRKCLTKWHGIKPGKELSARQIEELVDILMSWIHDQIKV